MIHFSELTVPYGLSFRHSPYDWSSASLEPLKSLRFGIWEVPLWMFKEQLVRPFPGVRMVISDIFPFAVLNNLAEDGTDKMMFDLAENLEKLAAELPKEQVPALTLDPGLSHPPPSQEDPAVTERRFKLLRLLWGACHRQGIRLLLPLHIPAENPEQLNWVIKMLDRAMCADLGLAVSVEVHAIRHLPEVEKLLSPLTFQIGFVRLCWNAGEGNELTPEWFAPWKKWVESADVKLPLIFEPNHFTVNGFTDCAKRSAILSGLLSTTPTQVFLDAN